MNTTDVMEILSRETSCLYLEVGEIDAQIAGLIGFMCEDVFATYSEAKKSNVGDQLTAMMRHKECLLVRIHME
jgi:hypothetical protein